MELIVADRPVVVRGPLYASLALLVVAFALSSVVQLNAKVRTQGWIRPKHPAVSLKTPFEGVLLNMAPAVGHHVVPGDLLAEIGSEVMAAEIDAKHAQIRSIQAEIAWQEADNRAETSRYKVARTAAADEVRRARRVLGISNQELAWRRDVVSKGLASVLEVEMSGWVDRLPGVEHDVRSAKAKRRMERVEHERLGVAGERRLEILNAREAELNAELRGLVARQAMGMVRANVAGVVTWRADLAAGALVGPSQQLFEVTPLDSGLFVEAAIADVDRPKVHTGQRAVIRVDSFPFRSHGALDGTVDYVAPDAQLRDADGRYEVRVRLENQRDLPVRPGMKVEVDLIGTRRTLIGHIYEAVVRASSSAAF